MKANATYTHQGQQLSCACELVWSARSLYIYLQNDGRDLLIWTPDSAEVRLSGATLYVQRKTDPQQQVVCTGPEARSIYDSWLQVPAPSRKQSSTSRPVYVFFIAVLLLLLGLAVSAYLFLVPWLAGRVVSLIPVSAEVSMGEQVAQVYRPAQASPADSAATAFIRQLGVHSPYTLQVTIVNSPEINAFAVPGGHIFVYTGLLQRLSSYEQFAALLSHELTHVVKRHSLKSMLRRAASGLILAAVFGDVSDLAPWLVSQADEFSHLNYSRELETEADAEALTVLQGQRIHPRGMLQLLQVLNEQETNTPALMKYLSTHPDTEARIQAVQHHMAAASFSVGQHPSLQWLFARVQAASKHQSN